MTLASKMIMHGREVWAREQSAEASIRMLCEVPAGDPNYRSAEIPYLVQLAVDYGFPHYYDSIIHIFEGGSSQHGAKLSAKSDVDVCGVYIPPVENIVGLIEDQHFITSTADQRSRNKPGDVDVSMFSLQKWAKLACKGNPTILGYIFMPVSMPGVWEDVIIPNRRLFLASSHANKFIGYGRAQLQRINGERGSGKHGQRDPLIDQFGYDVKAACHMIRLMCECYELLTDEVITYPRPEVGMLLEIRRGEWSRSQIEREYAKLEAEILDIQPGSSLPPVVDIAKVSKVVAEAHLRHWKYL